MNPFLTILPVTLSDSDDNRQEVEVQFLYLDIPDFRKVFDMKVITKLSIEPSDLDYEVREAIRNHFHPLRVEEFEGEIEVKYNELQTVN